MDLKLTFIDLIPEIFVNLIVEHIHKVVQNFA